MKYSSPLGPEQNQFKTVKVKYLIIKIKLTINISNIIYQQNKLQFKVSHRMQTVQNFRNYYFELETFNVHFQYPNSK